MRRFRMLAVLGSSFLLLGAGLVRAQQPPALPPPDQTLTPQQLENLVAPIALYPDPLLTQIMVAATYPLEVVEANQWLQHNPGLTGTALTEAAQQQNWDASVQALVVFPDVMKQLNSDVTWTTNLGNAFLAQQAEVMDAVQRLRQQAQQSGKLASNAQETVTSAPDPNTGAPAIDIEPASPDVVYVPVYNPAWFWGPALYYPYPGWYWPAAPVGGLYFGWGPGIRMGLFFGTGWNGWGGWGWHPGWGGHTIIVNNTFIHRYNFNSTHLAQLHGTSVWAHDPAHRVGVPYTRPELSNRFQSNVRENLRTSPTQQARQSVAPSNERIGGRSVPQSNPRSGVFGGMGNGQAARINSDHGYSSLGAGRTGGGGGRPSAPAGRRK